MLLKTDFPTHLFRRSTGRLATGLTALSMTCLLLAGTPALADADAAPAAQPPSPSPSVLAAKPAARGHHLDTSGRKRVGKASVYAPKFAGRKMADGTRMDPRDDNAASKTLPLGTRARVTNLKTGRSALVTIKDRGPYVGGRIVDLSPASARQIGLTPDVGIAPVEVTPITVPLPDGGVKLGEAASPDVRLAKANSPY